jgi:hypothetical protein
MLKLLDICARRCGKHIAQMTPHYRPSGTFDSLNKFRVGAMAEVLVRQLGVKYNPMINDGKLGTEGKEITDPADTFIHGVLGPRRSGACASLPVVLVALGRRLGYPLKWVLAPAHTFCRWDSPEERFNIEYDECGIRFHDDEHYKQWPYKWPLQAHEKERRRPFWLVSLTPRQELAELAWSRAYHLNIVGGRRRMEALATMQVAHKLWPASKYALWIVNFALKAFYPEREWPQMPCHRTTGMVAIQRLLREKGAAIDDAVRRGLCYREGLE